MHGRAAIPDGEELQAIGERRWLGNDRMAGMEGALLPRLPMRLTPTRFEADTYMSQATLPTVVSATPEVGHDEFIPSRSSAMRVVDEVAKGWSIRRVPILLVGEAGTGKRTLAAQMHQTYAADGGVLRAVNCSGLTAQLLAEQWSYENSHDLGDVNTSDTYVLENICDLAPGLQSLILPLVTAAVSSESRPYVGLLATSEHELQLDVHAGAFREDLYYLISGMTVTIPPLRYRREDILPFADFFLEAFARELRRPLPSLSASMQRFLLEYPWPGNVAELRETARVIVAFGDASLAMAALRSRAQEAQRNGRPHNVISLKQAARAASRQAERELILKVLSRTRWNRKRAAQELQISYKAMLYKLKQVGLDARFSEREQA